MQLKVIAAMLVLGLVLAVGFTAQAQTGSGNAATPSGSPSACASPSPGSMVASPTTAAGPPLVSPTAGTPTDCATPVGSPSAGGTSFEVDGIDIGYKPNTLEIPANTDVTVVFKNTGVLPHNFSIDELGVDSGDLNGGESASLTINAGPGTYQFYCDVPGHKDAGMVGTLTVK
jgi:plastocyanin